MFKVALSLEQKKKNNNNRFLLKSDMLYSP